MAVAPESPKVVRLPAEDLFTVVLEHFLTDTADHADYVLPATTQLEHWDVHGGYGHTYVVLNQPAVPPQGQARSNAQIFRDLAARMGFDAPVSRTMTDPGRQVYEGVVDFDELLQVGWARIALARGAAGRWRLPHALGQAWSSPMPGAMPRHVPNYESRRSNPALRSATRWP